MLNIRANPLINNINHMYKLKVLYCGKNSIISNKHISNLNLEKLYCYGNNKITKLFNMSNLQIIKCTEDHRNKILFHENYVRLQK